MGGIIITSSANHSRIRQARAWLEARTSAEEILILAANADAAKELVREVALLKGAAFGWHRLSLPQFAVVLAAPPLAARGIVPLGPLGIQAICARVVSRLAAESALGRYANIANGPGFATALARVVTELRSAKLRPGALSSIAPDLLPLVEAYEANLREDGFTDWAGLLTIATDAVMSEGFAHPLIGLPTTIMDVPVTTEAELDFLRAFGPRIPELLFLTPAADERTFARVQAALPMEVINLDEAKPDAASANGATGELARLQRHLFKETSVPVKLADDDEVLNPARPSPHQKEASQLDISGGRLMALSGSQLPPRDTSAIRHEADLPERRTDVAE